MNLPRPCDQELHIEVLVAKHFYCLNRVLSPSMGHLDAQAQKKVAARAQAISRSDRRTGWLRAKLFQIDPGPDDLNGCAMVASGNQVRHPMIQDSNPIYLSHQRRIKTVNGTICQPT